jgi:hypothetical protein
MEPVEALFEYEHKGYVFKRCKNSNRSYDCLVIMKKPENFKCNELRPSVHNKNFAKFRCNGLITVAIYDLNLKKFISTLDHKLELIYSYYATYKVGTLTEPDNYVEDISVVCASGIHYFLSLEAALSYNDGLVQHLKDGKIDLYDDDGQIIGIKRLL